MNKSPVRVRFAPSPTGMMHLGNVRTALMNYLFAQQKQGTFIVRIEDTDFERNYDPEAKQILADLAWLGLDYQEGPVLGGPHDPYFQSMRTQIYLDKLQQFEQKNLVYRCFCTKEELDKKRQRQLALKLPPRYDRACLDINAQDLENRLRTGQPFIWRFKLNQDEAVLVHDLAHGTISFDMKSFSDIPLTRQDGSFTFMFANFVDDVLMEITHVLRGEDHLSNTAGQVAMYLASGLTPPIFWHLPIICNALGAKLSKRDFGFSLQDLRAAGFLPDALVNYLAIIGGSFKQEIMSLKELAQAMPFDQINPTSQIKYDVEKLRWINHKWINQYSPDQLTALCLPYLQKAYAHAHTLPFETLQALITLVKTDLTTLADSVTMLEFYFKAPTLTKEMFAQVKHEELATIIALLEQHPLSSASDNNEFLDTIKRAALQNNITNKVLFVTLRIALTGKPHGLGLQDLINTLGTAESQRRLTNLTQLS